MIHLSGTSTNKLFVLIETVLLQQQEILKTLTDIKISINPKTLTQKFHLGIFTEEEWKKVKWDIFNKGE